MQAPVPPPFSPEDMARRRRRSIVMAVILLAFVALFFISTLVRLGANIVDRTM